MPGSVTCTSWLHLTYIMKQQRLFTRSLDISHLPSISCVATTITWTFNTSETCRYAPPNFRPLRYPSNPLARSYESPIQSHSHTISLATLSIIYYEPNLSLPNKFVLDPKMTPWVHCLTDSLNRYYLCFEVVYNQDGLVSHQ